ncbi:MAG: hypothetical protein Q9166_005763 [cf. Caloplaca sp. 2 TL-2023]
MFRRRLFARAILSPCKLSSRSRPSVLGPHLSPQYRAASRQYASNPRRPRYNRFQETRDLWKSSAQFRIGVVVVGGGIVIWIGSNVERAPVTGRWRFICVSEEYEAVLGKTGHQQLMQQYRGRILRPTDPRYQMVGRVLERLLPNSGLKGDVEFHVIDDENELNAFVLPGRRPTIWDYVRNQSKANGQSGGAF